MLLRSGTLLVLLVCLIGYASVSGVPAYSVRTPILNLQSSIVTDQNADSTHSNGVVTLIPHSPILINGNANFTHSNGVVSGRGTISAPYVIQGWRIESNQTYGIKIVDTTAFLVIRNVMIHTTFTDFQSYPGCTAIGHNAMLFEHVSNVRIENLTAESDASTTTLAALIISSSTNITVTNSIISVPDPCIDFIGDGMDVFHSRNISIENVSIAGAFDSDALFIGNSTDVRVSDSNLSSWPTAVEIHGSENLTISSSTIDGELIINNSHGVRIFHNNFVAGLFIPCCSNRWDDGYPSGGNYWANYAGKDNCTGPRQDICPSPDGIGDTPFGLDHYPLIHPFAPAVTATARLSPSVIGAHFDSQYLTAYVRLPQGVNGTDVVASSVRINDKIPIANETSPQIVRGTQLLAIEFNMSQVRALLAQPGDYRLLISGNIVTPTSFRPFTAITHIRLR